MRAAGSITFRIIVAVSTGWWVAESNFIMFEPHDPCVCAT